MICQLHAQNLIQNGGFEQFKRGYRGSEQRHFEQVESWRPISWQVFYCNNLEKEVPNAWYISYCDFEKYKPYSGHGMAKVIYEEAWEEVQISNNCSNGCTAYLQADFTTPLEFGEVYEISFWVFYPSTPTNLEAEAGIKTHIGFSLSLNAISMSANSMIDMPKYFTGNIEYDQWTQIKHYVRALCPLKTITIGLFRNSTFPVQKKSPTDDLSYPFYFVDDVSVIKMNAEAADTIVATPFCRFFEEEAERLAVATEQSCAVHFDINESLLDEGDKNALDSFIANSDKRWKPVYTIVGHTDSTGSENETLSLKRTEEVMNYLDDRHHIPEFRLVCMSKASAVPIADNKTLKGRALNRRVEVRVSSLSHSMGLYRQVLKYVNSEDLTAAFTWIERWMNSVTGRERILILFDPRLTKLRQSHQWNLLEGKIRDVYNEYHKPRDAYFLDSMYCEDQRFRTLEPMLYNLTGMIEGLDTFHLTALNAPFESMHIHDKKNQLVIKNYLQLNGFPIISNVGRGQVKGVIYNIVHAEDPEWIANYLPVIKDNCLRGEAEWYDYAIAHDKYLRLIGSPQEYGMQHEFTNKKPQTMKLAPVDDLYLTNERRKRIGLRPLSKEELNEEVLVKMSDE